MQTYILTSSGEVAYSSQPISTTIRRWLKRREFAAIYFQHRGSWKLLTAAEAKKLLEEGSAEATLYTAPPTFRGAEAVGSETISLSDLSIL